MIKPVLQNPWVQAIGLILAIALVCLLAYLLSFVLIPLMLAFLAAYFLDPVVDFFEARKIRRGTTTACLAVLSLILVLCIPFVLVPRILSEAYQLIEEPKELQAGETEAEQRTIVQVWGERAMEALPFEDLVAQLGWGEPKNEEEARAILAERVGEAVITFLRSHTDQFFQAGKATGLTLAQIFGSLGRGIVSTLIFLGNFALFAFVAGYLLRDFDTLMAAAKELLPPKYRGKTVEVLHKMDLQVRGFVRGQLTVCMCLGTMYAVGLLISGTPFAIPIALFGAVASFVPYLGPVMTLVPSLILTLLRHGVDWHILSVVMALVIAQAVEGNILTPRIVGENVGLGEVWVILAILVFGSVLGFLGMLLALPIAAALKVLVLEGVEYYRRSPVFEWPGSGDGTPPADSSG